MIIPQHRAALGAKAPLGRAHSGDIVVSVEFNWRNVHPAALALKNAECHRSRPSVLDLILAADDMDWPSAGIGLSMPSVVRGGRTGVGLAHDIDRAHIPAHFAADGALA